MVAFPPASTFVLSAVGSLPQEKSARPPATDSQLTPFASLSTLHSPNDGCFPEP
jgi:hypothetical protein